MPSRYKESQTKSLSGLLDNRSAPGQMSEGSFRFRQNMASNQDGQVCRRQGWSKLLSGNSDYHDQLLPLQIYYGDLTPAAAGADSITVWPNSTKCGSTLKTRDNGREVVTFGQEFSTLAGTRRFVIGTQSRLLVLNEATNNYRLLADGFGGAYDSSLSRRWYADKLKNTVIFTNNYDAPVSWKIDDQAAGCDMRSVKKIPDLEVIRLTRAACVVEYGGAILLGNVVMDGQRLANRIVWSDFADGTSFDPAKTDSVSGYFSLEDGEFIMEMKKLGNQLFVYTTTSVYLATITGNADGAFTFAKIYKGPMALKYRNTLVDVGTAHYYAGADGVYKWNPFQQEPEYVDWIQKSTGVMYSGGTPGYLKMNKTCCDSHVAGFNPITNEMFLSWAEVGSCMPTKTLVFNMKSEFTDLVDHGFSMFSVHTPDSRPSLRDFLLSTCACSASSLKNYGVKFVKEGMPAFTCPAQPQGFIPNSIYTPQATSINGVIVERFALDTADTNSLCAFIGDQGIEDFCKICDAAPLFIAASTTDWCLKNLSADVYSREMCTNSTTATGPGTPYNITVEGEYTSFTGSYTLLGYYTLVRSGPDAFEGPSLEKNLKRMLVELSAGEQIYPCVLFLRIGKSYSALDPNNQTCSILWTNAARKYLVCPNQQSAEYYAAHGLVPAEGIEWPLYVSGRYLYYELTIASLTDQDDLTSTLVPALGGASCFSAVRQTIRNINNIAK